MGQSLSKSDPAIEGAAMGFLDKAKQQLTKAVDQHGDKIADGADKLSDKINEKTDNKHADKVAKGKEQLKKGLDSLDGKNDDFGKRP
jgi:MT0933-like antitoxin protein